MENLDVVGMSRFPSGVRDPHSQVASQRCKPLPDSSGPRIAFVNQYSFTEDLVSEVLSIYPIFSSDLEFIQ